MLDEHLTEDSEQIKFLLDNNIYSSTSLKRILFEEYWLKITKNDTLLYVSDIANSIAIPPEKIADRTTLTVKTNQINFTADYDVIFRLHVKHYDDGTTIILGISMDNSIKQNQKKLATIFIITLIIISALFYYLVNFLLKPLVSISLTLRRLSQEKFSLGLVQESNDEIGFLIESINLTFEKLRNHFTYQKDFLSIMSHELKTPLSVIKNHIENAIEREDIPLVMKEKFSNDLEQISKLNQFIHRLMLLTRLEDKTIIPKSIRFNLSELAHELCQFFTDLAESQNKVFTSEISNQIFIVGDKGLIYRAIFNIVDNAIKYTPEEKEIHLILKCIDPKTAILQIRDQGEGISEEVIMTAESSMFSKSIYDQDGIKNGIGMRLIIAILNLHTLKYKIQSTQNGSIFTIFFKIA
ncbi:HAMP domain-containing sensor histidine kinase [Sulfurospirillum diekertiae]|nr:HAMP domain-containing sensor histidine kinase [Sulfurospirillum diekertiae]